MSMHAPLQYRMPERIRAFALRVAVATVAQPSLVCRLGLLRAILILLSSDTCSISPQTRKGCAIGSHASTCYVNDGVPTPQCMWCTRMHVVCTVYNTLPRSLYTLVSICMVERRPRTS